MVPCPEDGKRVKYQLRTLLRRDAWGAEGRRFKSGRPDQNWFTNKGLRRTVQALFVFHPISTLFSPYFFFPREAWGAVFSALPWPPSAGQVARW